jgi:hypothetical protein
MSAAQRLADAVKASPQFANINPIDMQRFAINWLLEEIDRLTDRIDESERRITYLEGDGK